MNIHTINGFEKHLTLLSGVINGDKINRKDMFSYDKEKTTLALKKLDSFSDVEHASRIKQAILNIVNTESSYVG